ncbi:MAG: DUF748 domain-containing protein, partial [bacterium]|nr:DUF748 domain-containing protein [bacterium]
LLLFSLHVLVDIFENEIFGFFIERIERKSDGNYSIKYDVVNLDLARGRIHIKNLSVTPGDRGGVKATLPFLKVEGISLLRLVAGKSLGADEFSVKGGEFVIVKARNAKPKKKANDTVKKPWTFSIKNVSIRKTAFKWIESSGKIPLVCLDIPELLLRLSKLKIRGKVIRFGDGESILKKPVFVTADRFYTVKAEQVKLSRTGSSIAVKTLELIPRYKKYQFSRKRGYRISRHSLTVANVMFKDVDFSGFFKERCFHSRLLSIEKPVWDIFRDRRVPKSTLPKSKKFPRELLLDLKFGLRIDSVTVSNGRVDYAERVETARRPGKIFFSGIRANLDNVGNDPKLLKKKIPMVLTASTKLMGKGLLKVNITVPLNSRKNRFNFSGSLGWMDMRVFNAILENNVHIRVDRGTLKGLHFFAGADNKKAEGEMKFSYKDLDISVLRKSREYKKRKVISFLANTVIRGDNPRPGRRLRVGKIFFEREKPVSFLNYMLKSLLSGVKSSIGL